MTDTAGITRANDPAMLLGHRRAPLLRNQDVPIRRDWRPRIAGTLLIVGIVAMMGTAMCFASP